MAEPFSYRDLEIWQLGMDLTVDLYRASESFPDSERYGITAQLRRAAVSVPLNVSEGWGRGTQPYLAQGVRIARGSLCEAETVLELSRRLGFISGEDLAPLSQSIATLGRKSHAFLKKVESSYIREMGADYGEGPIE